MNAQRSPTAGLAALVTGAAGGPIPAAARTAARRALLDTIGVALAGAAEECTQIVWSLIASAEGRATVLGGGRASWLDAALVNGVAAHALDYDDTHQSVRGHPSAAIVPAALAAAEHVGASGEVLLDGYVVGLEVAGRVGRGLGPSHAANGFHSSSTLGVVGAAAAAARILRLDHAMTVTALGLAASGASGLRLNFGTMAKPLHAGNAARGGLLAAELARRGFTASPIAFDGTFQRAYSPGDGQPTTVDDAGWQILDPGNAVKKYPCCNRAHRAADAILDLVTTHRFQADEVDRIDVHLTAGEVDEAGRVGPMIHPCPTTGLEAKFSLPYVMTAAVLDGELVIDSFTDAQLHRPAAQALMARVHPIADADRPPGDYHRVVVGLRDGRVVERTVHWTRGDPRGGDPVSDEDLARKFRDCARTALTADQTEAAYRLLADIEHVPDIRAITAHLSCPPKAAVR